MNAHVRPSIDNPESYDEMHLRIAIESFQKSRFGYLPSFMYDASNPETGYIGGGESWENFIGSTTKYVFPKLGRFLLSNKSGDIVSSILSDTNHRHAGMPWHFVSLAPGTEFHKQDYQLVTALINAVDSRGEQLNGLTVEEINQSFEERSVKFASDNLELPQKPLRSSRNIFSNSLGDFHSSKLPKENYRSVVLWTGGTIGNVGYKLDEQGFPEEQIIKSLQLQVDHNAAECYIVVMHNAHAHPDVLESFSEAAHSDFALSSMRGIQEHLPTEKFDHNNFSYKNRFNNKTDMVEHLAVSKVKQSPFIGNAGFRLNEGDIACTIGHSAQITNARMGNISTRGGFTRVASFPKEDNPKTIATILKATDPLMEALRNRQQYRIAA